MLRATVILHEREEGLGRLEQPLRDAGFELSYQYRPDQLEAEDAPLAVILGGPMGIRDADRFPFLSAELRLLARRLAQGRPVLGVCLGAQLLAAAAGAAVHAGAQGLELGVFPVTLSNAGRADPLFQGMPAQMDFAHWHEDTFDPVPGATHLASTAPYPQQAFRLQDSYGFQFHLEVDGPTFARWMKSAPAGYDAARVLHDSKRLSEAQPQTDLLLRRLAEHFARVCG